jgi:hypothetical protein
MGRRIGTLGLVNYADHPTDAKYKVFNFNKPEEAAFFEAELNRKNIWFEKDTETVKDELMYLFAVEQKYAEKAHQINYDVSAKFRGHIIKHAFLRWALILFFFAVLALGIIGYVKN